MIWAALGMVAMLAATLPRYRRLCHSSYVIYGLSILLLVVVYFFRPVNGAHRWVRWGHVGCNRRSSPNSPSFSSWPDT